MTPTKSRMDWCKSCRRYLDNTDAIADHNLACASFGERQYTWIVGVFARTVEAHRITQGAGIKAGEAYPR